MLSKLELIKFILDEKGGGEQKAEQIISAARALDLDLMKYMVHRLGMDEGETYKRAAQYCSLPFSSSVPRNLPFNTRIERLDILGSIDGFHATLFDREVLFTSPSMYKIIALGEQVAASSDSKINICIVPPNALKDAILASNSERLMDEARQRLARRWPFASAHLDLTIPARIVFLTSLFSLIGFVAFAPLSLTPLLLPLLFLLFLLPAWFRLAALFEFTQKTEKGNARLLDGVELPVYSLLIPLRDEAQMVPQLARAMLALDYPPEKLDIKFIVETASKETVAAVRKVLINPCFELVEVPKGPPHTKPKALDYALPLVRGEYVVIYDAEDIPAPDQLRLAATRFHNDIEVDCVQAELVIDNADESWLTALFAAEYSGLFGVMLPALSRWRFPMPLGGTSNHFRVRSLREVGGWDAFNVTEDADLGVRLSRLRYRTGTLSSHTYEEAPVGLGQWMRQRTRWMKGWMQTFIVHNRYPVKFLKDAGWRSFLAFQIYVGSLIISAPLHSVFFIALAVRYAMIGNAGFLPGDIWLVVHLFVLVAGYIATATHSIAGVLRLKKYKLLFLLPTLPLYWALSGVASVIAAYELMVKPYFWAKTTHGITRKQRGKGHL